MAGLYAKQIIRLYERKVLEAQLGIQQEVRDALTKGLESIFEEVSRSKINSGSNCFRRASPDLLEKPLDYDAMRKIAQKAGVPRCVGYLKHTLRNNDIRSYGDLLMLIENNINSKGVAHPLRSKKNPRDVLRFRGMGNESLRAMYTHLNGLGIKIFADGYKPELELFPKTAANPSKVAKKVFLTQNPGENSRDYQVTYGGATVKFIAEMGSIGNPPIYPVKLGNYVRDYGTSFKEADEKAYLTALREAQMLAADENTYVVNKTSRAKFPRAVALSENTRYTDYELHEHRFFMNLLRDR